MCRKHFIRETFGDVQVSVWQRHMHTNIALEFKVTCIRRAAPYTESIHLIETRTTIIYPVFRNYR